VVWSFRTKLALLIAAPRRQNRDVIKRPATVALAGCLALLAAPSRAAAAPPDLVPTFQALEQSLMDAVGVGDKRVWDRVLDDSCVVTSEEGQVSSKAEILNGLQPLPPGLSGGIAVRDLTVQPFSDFAVVRYVADEWEQVFGQRLTTKYRTTDTFRRAGARWKLVASHTAVVTADPPAQTVDGSRWSDLAGTYQLRPDGWTFHVELRDGTLYGGRDPAKLRPFVPITPLAFVLSGSLGEWLFVPDRDGHISRIVDLRKFEPLVWSRVDARKGVGR